MFVKSPPVFTQTQTKRTWCTLHSHTAIVGVTFLRCEYNDVGFRNVAPSFHTSRLPNHPETYPCKSLEAWNSHINEETGCSRNARAPTNTEMLNGLHATVAKALPNSTLRVLTPFSHGNPPV